MLKRELIRGLGHPASVLVIGATGGVGGSAVALLLAEYAVERVIAASRSGSRSEMLVPLAQSSAGRLTVDQVDITDEASLAALSERIGAHTSRLHLVLNCTGRLHDAALVPEKTVAGVTRASLEASFAVNAFGPILLAKALLPLLRHGEPAVFASISARVGSIGDNRLGGWYAYRAAKAAQNQLLKTFSIELARVNKRAACLLLHPGTVDTALSRPFQRGVSPEKLFSPERAARQLLEIIARSGPENSGSFVAWDGALIPW